MKTPKNCQRVEAQTPSEWVAARTRKDLSERIHIDDRVAPSSAFENERHLVSHGRLANTNRARDQKDRNAAGLARARTIRRIVQSLTGLQLRSSGRGAPSEGRGGCSGQPGGAAAGRGRDPALGPGPVQSATAAARVCDRYRTPPHSERDIEFRSVA